MTPEERILWREVRRNQINGVHFRRQQVIDGLIADFYSNDAALVIEIDGPVHQAIQEYDEQRDLTFQARGLRVMHLANEDVRDRLPAVIEKIRKVCAKRIYPGFKEVP
jgi:very-short-patch-repair endonuclease